MSNWIVPLYPALMVLAFAFIPVFLIIWALQWHQKRYKQKVISPISAGFLREAGHSLRIKYEDLRLDAMSYLIFLVFLPIYPLAYIGASSLVGSDDQKPFLVLVTILALLFAVPKIWLLLKEIRKIRLGLEAEIACGQELDQLMREGWYVFHDVPASKGKTTFNIDHILIGPPGVFVVETKGRSKPLSKSGEKKWKVEFANGRLQFPGWNETAPIEQAQMNSSYVSSWLPRASGVRFTAEPVLLFPGWYFEAKSKPPFPLIGNPKIIIQALSNKKEHILTPEQREQIAHQLEQVARLKGIFDEK